MMESVKTVKSVSLTVTILGRENPLIWWGGGEPKDREKEAMVALKGKDVPSLEKHSNKVNRQNLAKTARFGRTLKLPQ